MDAAPGGLEITSCGEEARDHRRPVPEGNEAAMRDDDLRRHVAAELAWHYQREAAESRTTGVPGVAGIDNAITLTQAPDARAAADAIGGAFARDAVLAADVLSVETP